MNCSCFTNEILGKFLNGNFSILCRKRVAVGWGLQQDSHSLGKRVVSSAGPGDGQMQERQEELHYDEGIAAADLLDLQ